MMLVLGSEQLVGRQHLYQPSSDDGIFPSLYRLILVGEDPVSQRRGLVLQLTDEPLGATHSPPLSVEPGNTHMILLITPLMLSSKKYDPLG